jgi:class 3 adenylate cyclase/tetratricopeptide (TPR) repeat protein
VASIAATGSDPTPVECTACGHANPPGSRFCGACGRELAVSVQCDRCGAENPPDHSFCSQCGQRLGAAPAPEPEPSHAIEPVSVPAHLAERVRAERAELEGERKQVTVMFADVVGSMRLAELTDAETWQRIMDRFLAIVSDGVHRFEGTVDKFTGDGAMALFGAPIAHEDHARRTCLAALHLHDKLGEFANELRRSEGLNLSVRIGLNSGEVVVGTIGDDLRLEYTAIGHTFGLAQRMESLAEPGRAYLTAHTAELVEGYFELDDLGEFDVKGVSEPLRVYALAGVGSARGRLDLSRARGFSRFVGREEEMATLDSALEHALAGDGQAIGIVGEAGVGKSRLCHEFAERARARGIPVYEAQGQAHAKTIPFLPVLQVLRSYFGIDDRDDDLAAREKIAGRLLLLDESFADDLPLLFEFLAVPDPERSAPKTDPEARQRQLLGLVKRLVVANSQRETGILLFEDLHWLDPGSELFLAAQIEAIQGNRNLTILNFRPEYSADWMRRSYYRQLPLAPLGPEEIDELLADLLGADPSLDGLPTLVRERTAGNPFFIEEVVRELVEAGNLEGRRGAYRLVRPVQGASVPATVQAVLAARIDRLPEGAKGVLQAASVIGKEFTHPVLERVADLDERALEATMAELVAAEFIYEQSLYPQLEYSFRHPLTREVAYRSQLTDRRTRTHAGVAAAIEEVHAGALDERAALLAYHWEEAGESLQAARWHARAADWAGYTAPAEALRHWRRVRELTMELPETQETTGLAMGSRTMILQFAWRLGLSDEEVAAVFEEGKELAEEHGDDATLSILLATYGTVRGLRGHIDEYVALTGESVGIAERLGEPAILVPMLVPASYARFVKGLLPEAVAQMERVLELTEADRMLGAGIGVGNPYGWCVMFRANLLALVGRIPEAQKEIERGIEIARAYEDTESLGWAHMNAVNIARLSGEDAGAVAHGQQAVEIAERIGDAFSRAAAPSFLGMAHVISGEPADALPHLERSDEIIRERRTGMELQPWVLSFLAEALARVGELDRATETARFALDLASQRGQWPSELLAHRATARVLLAAGDPGTADEIERLLLESMSLADRIDSPAETLQGRIDLVRLAELRSDESARMRALEAARALAKEIGATGHARRLAELAAVT